MGSTASSTGDHVDWPAIMLTFYSFGDHRLHTYGERRFFDRRSCWPMENALSSTGDHVDFADDHRLRTLGNRRFNDRRTCWPERRFIDRRSCLPFHTFDDHRLRSHGDHLFIDRRLSSFDLAKFRRPPTTHIWKRHFIDRRSWPPSPFICNF